VDFVLDSCITRQQETLNDINFIDTFNEDDVICEVVACNQHVTYEDDDLEFIREETVIPSDSPCVRQPLIMNSNHPFLEITSDDELNSSCIRSYESKSNALTKETKNENNSNNDLKAKAFQKSIPSNEVDLNMTVEILLSKLICPICYRNFRRKKFMTNYSKFLLKKQTEQENVAVSPSLNKEPVFDIPISSSYQGKDDLASFHRAYEDSTNNISTCFLSNAMHLKNNEWSEEVHNVSPNLPSIVSSCTQEDSLTDEYETSELRVGRCGHVYCHGCIKKYVTLKKKCPVCNQSLTLRQLFPLYL
jgi:hypothetical protein